MGYQAHCIVMEEISKASGSHDSSTHQELHAHGLRQYWPILRRPFTALHKPAMSERQLRSEENISSRLDIRTQDRSTGNVGVLSRLGRGQHEDNGEGCRWRLSTKRHQDVDHECKPPLE